MLAELALVTGLQVNEPGVGLQFREIVEDALADGARYGKVAVLLAHVSLDGVLGRKCSVADAAAIAERIQVPHDKVVLHVRQIPSDVVTQLTGVLGLAVMYDHVPLQFVRRLEQLVADLARVFVKLHMLPESRSRSAREGANVAGVTNAHRSHTPSVLFTALGAAYVGSARRRVQEERTGLPNGFDLQPVDFQQFGKPTTEEKFFSL